MAYANLEQRMAQTYLDMFPGFVPEENAPVDESQQKIFYDLIKSLLKLAFNEPQYFAPVLHEDDAYPNRFNKSSYGKPELRVNMRKFLKAMDDLLQNMFVLGQGTSVKLQKGQTEILSKLGINDFTKLPAAWVWMATRPASNIVTFSHCFFKKGYPYTSDIYAPLLGEASFRKLENWMINKGYQSYDIFNVTASDCKLSLTYANPAWSKESPRGGFEYKIRHTGISICYEPLVREPPVMGLCIPNGLKAFLNTFDSMDKKLQDFILDHTKKCDACRYCVQTDKTGKRPLASVGLTHENINYNLCPYFPGYRYCWTSVNDKLVEQLVNFLSYMDKFAPA